MAEGIKEDVDLAVKAAHEAFDNGPGPRLFGEVTSLSSRLHCYIITLAGFGSFFEVYVGIYSIF